MKGITRRRLLGSCAVAAGAAVAAPWNLTEPLLGTAPALAVNGPNVNFPTVPRGRLAVASWPFRAEIDSDYNEYRDRQKAGIDLKDFAVKIRERFQVPGFEPLSTHFPATDERYLKSFRAEIEKAGVHVVNIPVENSDSFYDPDAAVRKRVVQHCKKWVDVAVLVGAPSVRTSVADTKSAKPDVELTAQTLRPLVEYGASKNIVINLENDDLVSEDAFFVTKVIEKVNHPYLHALPDFCNSMATGNSQFNYQAVKVMFEHAYSICHVKDSEVGDGGKVYRVSLKVTFDILKGSNYRGYCSMEWEGPENPYVGTERLIAASLENLA
jgi:sugar phosphate isomerase/epimerase